MRFKVPFRGVHIGPRCVDGSDFGPEVEAHSHHRGAPPVGWICARSLAAFRRHLVHEIAHLAADSGHNDSWRRSVHKLGGRVPAAYKKRSREGVRGRLSK